MGDVADVRKVFLLIEKEGPALGLQLNVKKNEIWWPSRGPSLACVGLPQTEGELANSAPRAIGSFKPHLEPSVLRVRLMKVVHVPS